MVSSIASKTRYNLTNERWSGENHRGLLRFDENGITNRRQLIQVDKPSNAQKVYDEYHRNRFDRRSADSCS